MHHIYFVALQKFFLNVLQRTLHKNFLVLRVALAPTEVYLSSNE